MSDKINGFYAYASNPTEIGQVIEAAVNGIRRSSGVLNVETWKALDVVGHFISDEVVLGIDRSNFLLADISVLNFNVTYEIAANPAEDKFSIE